MERKQLIITLVLLFLFALVIRLYDLDNMPTQDDEQLWLARSYAFVHSIVNQIPDTSPLTKIYSDNGSVDVFATGDNILPEQYPFTIRTEAHHPGTPSSLLIGLSYVLLADGSHSSSLNLVSTIVAIKLPNVLLGSVLVIVTFMGTRYLFTDRVALVTALMIAVSPLMIGYSRLGRIDMGSALWAVSMMFSYMVRVQQTTRRGHLMWTLAAGVFAGLAMATNPYGVYALPVFALVKILLTPSTKQWYERYLPDKYDLLFFVVWILTYIVWHPNLIANPVAGFLQWIDITFTFQESHIIGPGLHLLYLELILVTTLPTTLILFVLGVFGRLGKYRRKILILLVWILWFVLLLSIPSGKKNLKNLLQIMIPLSMIAGLGVDWLSTRIASWWKIRESYIFSGLVFVQILIGLGVTAFWHPLPHLYVSPGVYVKMDSTGNFATSNGVQPALAYAYANSQIPPKTFIAPGARNNLLFHLPEDAIEYGIQSDYETADWLIVTPKELTDTVRWYNQTEPTHVLVHRQVELANLYYLPDFFPREMIDTTSPMIRYDNGIEIYDMQSEVHAGELTFTSWWGGQPDDPYGFSLQIFDEDNVKVAQGDYLLPVKLKQVSLLDVDHLPAGEYRIQLIVYDLATASSLNGMQVDIDRSFERMVEVGSIIIEDS